MNSTKLNGVNTQQLGSLMNIILTIRNLKPRFDVIVSDLAQLVHQIIGIKIPVDILSVSLAGLIAQGLAVLHLDKVNRLSFSV